MNDRNDSTIIGSIFTATKSEDHEEVIKQVIAEDGNRM